MLSGKGQPGSGANILADDLLKRNSDGSESFSEETAEAAESAGKLAGRGSTPLSKLYRPIASKADWRMVLRGFVKSISRDEVDYLSYEFDEYGICEDILCCKPKSKLCVLTDESGSIEDGLYRQFLGELNKNLGITIIMVTHDISSIIYHSNKVLQLSDDGNVRIVESKTFTNETISRHVGHHTNCINNN